MVHAAVQPGCNHQTVLTNDMLRCFERMQRHSVLQSILPVSPKSPLHHALSKRISNHVQLAASGPY